MNCRFLIYGMMGLLTLGALTSRAETPARERPTRLCERQLGLGNHPPQIVRPGVLVELQDGTETLGICNIDLGPGHESILRQIVTRFAAKNPVRRVLWLGELEFRQDQVGDTELLRANEVSGTYAQYLGGRPVFNLPLENNVLSLAKYLEQKKIWSMPATEFIPYVQSGAHLEHGAERLRLELKLDNTAHSIGRILMKVSLALTLLDQGPLTPQELADLRGDLGSYLVLLEAVGPAIGADTRGLIAIVQRFLKSDRFAPGAVGELTTRHERLAQEWLDRQRSATKNIVIFAQN